MTLPNDPATDGRPPELRSYRPARSEFRSRQHHSAHNEDAVHRREEYPDHRLIPRGDAEMITTPTALDRLIDHLRAVGRFAYDSEFIGELTYIPKLCVIQVASSEQVALVDPLARFDLTPFWDLICDASVEKIVHAGLQDLEPAVRATKKPPANVFDTQISAGFLGMTYPVALSKLVRELTGAHLGKGLTFTHWDQRPLSAMQLRYAADDVRFLPALRDEIGKRLDSLGHTAWAAEECATLCDPGTYRFDPEVQYRRVRGATSLQGTGLTILRELVVWRDGAARAHDVPPRSFLRDEILVDLARNPIKSIEKLVKVKGLPRPIELAHGKEIVEATVRGAAAPVTEHPQARSREETPTEKFRADALWAAAECISLGQSVDPNLIASRAEIGQLYRHLTTGETAGDIPLLAGWRFEAVGKQLIDVVKNGAKVQLEWASGSLKTTAAIER